MPIIEDFENSLWRNSKPYYAQWRAVDLHNHSPASHDYSGDKANAIEAAVRHLSTVDVDIIMFTDHHTLADQIFIEKLRQATGKTILRGTEVNIFVDAWGKPKEKVEKQAFFHLLIGFSPDTDEDYWFKHLNENCGLDERTISGSKIQGLTFRVDQICETLTKADPIIIPAHLHTNHKAFKSRSADDIYTDEEFLKFARDHFTALEVTDSRTADFFDGTRQETNYLHKACIQSSDAHDVVSIGHRVSYVQMESPTFAEVKAGLEIPFRVSLDKPAPPPSHIIGINIRGQFFQDLWVSLSPNCNALIGVKGSGKTSVLECLRFALGAVVPDSRKEEVHSHLSHILGQSGSVGVLVKRQDGAKVLIERSASNPDVFSLVFEDDRREEIRNPDALLFNSFILGWHEIEQAATDSNVRQAYLDTIAGREKIRQLQETADEGIGHIRSLHEQVANRYSNFLTLRRRVSQLRDLRSGLKELSDTNLVNLKNSYEIATRQRDTIKKLARWLVEQAKHESKNQPSPVVPDLPSLDGESPIQVFADEASEILNGIREHVKEYMDSYREVVKAYVANLDVSMPKMENAFDDFAAQYDTAVAALPDEQRKLLESHREVLDQTSVLPAQEKKLEEEQGKLEELLAELSNHCDCVARAFDDQTALRNDRVEELSSQLIEYGVRLEVSPCSRLSMFENLERTNPTDANIYGQLANQFSPSERHHRRLAKAYEGARTNLIDGSPLLLSSMTFGDYLAAFEKDDLHIYFDVSKDREDYRAIDQLSAGQRCTAVFPLLLKLQEGPLIVDQPEDNLDNRHIADTIAPALVEDKKVRQIVFTSHNANLVVLTDAEQIAMFESDGAKGSINTRGFLCTKQSTITPHVIAVLDGGQEALRLRYQKYGVSEV